MTMNELGNASPHHEFLSIAPWDDFFDPKTHQSAKMIIPTDDICAAGIIRRRRNGEFGILNVEFQRDGFTDSWGS